MYFERSEFHPLIEDAAKRHKVPAASFAISVRGEVNEAAIGVLSTATGVEATEDSVFQIGSISKVYTATLAMQLVDEGTSAGPRVRFGVPGKVRPLLQRSLRACLELFSSSP